VPKLRDRRVTDFLFGGACYLSGAAGAIWAKPDIADWALLLMIAAGACLFLLSIVGCIQEVTHAETKQPPQS